jgi:hypothetical protein
MHTRFPETLALGGGRKVTLRLGRASDAPALQRLYGRLSSEDVYRRFFSGCRPPTSYVETWASIDERGGGLLIAEVAGPADTEPMIVAEAGWSPLDDGNGELAITVDPHWRGWLGVTMFERVRTLASQRGVLNLEAEVLVENCVMLGLMRHVGCVTAARTDANLVRLVIATSGDLPGWPPVHDHPRLLVEGASWWRGEKLARAAGWDVICCPGAASGHRCPLDGSADEAIGRCPLVDGADAAVVLVAGAPLGVDRLHATRPELPVLADDGSDDIDTLVASLTTPATT